MSFLPFNFGFGRRRGADPQPAAEKVDPAASEQLRLKPEPALGTEIRGLDIGDPAIFSAAGLNNRALAAAQSLQERLKNRTEALPEEQRGQAGRLMAHHMLIAGEGTALVKQILPDASNRFAGEYYRVSRFDEVQKSLPLIEKKLLELEAHGSTLARGEQATPEMQSLAVEVGRATADFIAGLRRDAAVIQAVSIREYPRGALCDTVMTDASGKFSFEKSASGYLVFQNRDILRVNLRAKGEFPASFEGLPVGVADSGRHVIQQSGMQGCVGASTNMVLMDFGRKPDLEWQRSSHFDNESHILAALQRAGLQAELISIPRRHTPPRGIEDRIKVLSSLDAQAESLERAAGSGNPVLLALSCEVGGHQVVLDAFSRERNRATIRDPLHGWSIDVSCAAVLARFGSSTAIVVSDPRRA